MISADDEPEGGDHVSAVATGQELVPFGTPIQMQDHEQQSHIEQPESPLETRAPVNVDPTEESADMAIDEIFPTGIFIPTVINARDEHQLAQTKMAGVIEHLSPKKTLHTTTREEGQQSGHQITMEEPSNQAELPKQTFASLGTSGGFSPWRKAAVPSQASANPSTPMDVDLADNVSMITEKEVATGESMPGESMQHIAPAVDQPSQSPSATGSQANFGLFFHEF
jgi:hypothetical protein